MTSRGFLKIIWGRKKLISSFLAVLLPAPWPIAYAHSNDSDAAGQDAVQIKRSLSLR